MCRQPLCGHEFIITPSRRRDNGAIGTVDRHQGANKWPEWAIRRACALVGCQRERAPRESGCREGARVVRRNGRRRDTHTNDQQELCAASDAYAGRRG